MCVVERGTGGGIETYRHGDWGVRGGETERQRYWLQVST